MIEFREVEKRYPNGYEALRHINLTIDQGEFVAIIGLSGAGKSTLIRTINRMHDITQGQLTVDGTDVMTLHGKSLRRFRRKIGMIFQSFNLITRTTVIKNVLTAFVPDLPGWRATFGIFTKEEKMKALEALDQMGILDKAFVRADQLSGGQQQRVALARILSCSPDIIMLDEPFSALDGYLKDTLQLEMQEVLAGYGKDVLFVSHSRDEIFKFCSRMCLISGGSSMLVGDTREIFSRPGTLEAARLTGCKNFSAVEKLSDYELYASDWNFRMKTAERIGDDIRYVAVRGHWLIPSWEKGQENTMAIEEAGYTETPFEKQYLFVNREGENNSRIWWMVNKKDFIDGDLGGLPPYMIFPKEHIMLLR